jgi:hypothetical protein
MDFKKTLLCMTTALLWGCGSESAGTGAVSFSTWGEDYIEKEIPAADFADGWTIKFSKFLIVLGDIRVADETGSVGAQMETTILIDHHVPGVKPIQSFSNLVAKPWTDVSFVSRPADANTALGPGVMASDLTMMKDQGYAIYVEASAEKGAEKKTLRWGFEGATQYAQCRGGKDGREIEGVLVTNGGTDDVELTIHGDHFFYDDLQSPEASVRFDAIASTDVDLDGEITLAELTQKKLVDIDPSMGGYGTGILADVNDLGAFVTVLARTLGHFRGEGECIAKDVGSK